jgi:hypothetical protein
MINNAVHVVMYSYYLLSAEGSPRTKKFLRKYKKWITLMQMVGSLHVGDLCGVMLPLLCHFCMDKVLGQAETYFDDTILWFLL